MNGKTTHINVQSESKQWHFIDASGKVLGRLAVDISKLLLGKNKAYFSPNENFSDKVVITNVEKITVTGNKKKDKIYYTHSGFAKGFKKETLSNKFERNPESVLREAVKGMLPKNKLQKQRMANLYVYKGPEHPHAGQEIK